MAEDKSYHIKEIEVDNSWQKDLMTDEYRQYREKWDLASQKQQLYDFPLFLEIESSYGCNYSCPKCPRELLPHTKVNGLMSDEIYDRIFAEAKERGLYSLAFSHGGEPLLRRGLPDLVRKAKEANIIDRMFHTNASLLTKQLSTDLIKSGLTKINFSLDAASPEVYNKVRVGGKYERIIANIEDFLEIKKQNGKSYPRVRVSFVISDENKHEQDAFFELWKDKVNLIAFQQCYDFSKMNTTGNEENKENDKEKLQKKYCCSQLWQLLTVTYDGDILICERDYQRKKVLGNLKTHTLYECWHSDEMNRFRELHLQNRWSEIPMCQKCVTCVE